MSDTLVVPGSTTYPQRIKMTRQMCHFLVENGLLTERYELINGVIYLKMPVKPPHRIALMLLRNWLLVLFGLDCVQTEDPIALPGEEGNISEPEPDAAVTLEPTTAYNDRNPGPSDVLLVAEVADSSLHFDLNDKAAVYARVGISEYWVLDLNNRQIHRHRQPSHGGYGEVVVFGEEESISAPGRIEIIRVGELLPPVASA